MKLWKIEQVGAVVVARYHNPPMNYFTSEAVSEFKELVESWHDPAIRAIILTGATPGLFITHYSVEELHALACDQELLRSGVDDVVDAYHAMLLSLRLLPKPVIAAMTGDTMGGGFELTMSCDIRIAAAGDYRIGLPEVRLGILPGGTGTQALPRMIGLAKAVEFILRGRIVGPDLACQMGLVHEVADDPVARALEVARDMTAQSASAIAAAKESIYRGADLPLDEALVIERAMFKRAMLSPDAEAYMADYLSQDLARRRNWIDTPI